VGKVKVAVIGVGGWGRNFVRIFSELDGCKLVAVCDVNENRVRDLSQKYGVEYFTDHRSMLEKVKDLDAAAVVTPTPNHYETAMCVINAGKHVFVEKPICDSSIKAKKLVKAALKRKVKLTVGHIERFNPAVQELKNRLDNGELGDIISIAARRVGRPVKVSEIGVVRDLAVHDIDIMRFLIGNDPKSVFARCGAIEKPAFEDHAEIMLSFDDVKSGYIEVNWLTLKKERSLTVTCSDAVGIVNYVDRSLVIEYPTRNAVFKFAKEEPLRLELSNFLDCILHNRPPMVTGVDGLRALEIAEAALKSARTLKVIKI